MHLDLKLRPLDLASERFFKSASVQFININYSDLSQSCHRLSTKATFPN